LRCKHRGSHYFGQGYAPWRAKGSGTRDQNFSRCQIEEITGAPSYSVGLSIGGSEFGGTLGTAVGANNVGVVGPSATYAPTDVVVSAGNTGALMAMSKFCLRTLAHIERPAIAGIWPTLKGESIVLDIGATIGADAHQLMDFALMGGAMARALFEAQRPTVGLLNVGVEEVKGQEEVKEAGRLIREANLPTISYHGFVEGDDIGKGTVDVVVTEGFTGNIALKTAEGTARQIAELLREAMSRTWLSKLGYLLAKGAFDRLREKMDPRKVNGGVFLGLNGIVIKSHGGTDAEGFAAAIDVGYDMARNGLTEKIVEDLETYHARRQPPAGPEAA